MKKRILFILNPISGTSSKDAIPGIIEETLDKNRFDYELRFTERAGQATELAAAARDQGYDVVCAVGGDGTVNEVARSLVHSRTALAILPCGSGNGLARHLMIPQDMKQAVEVINDDVIHDLDYGVINGHDFFCTCGMGFDAFISLKFAEGGKRGPITYVEDVLKEGLRYKPETYELEDETGKRRYKAFLISIANASQYGNNAYIAPQASMHDGMMDVIILEPFDLLEAPQVSMDLFNKTMNLNSKIKTFRCNHIKIHREHPGVIHFDGDPVMSAEDIDVRIEKQSLPVVVNAHADKEKRKPTELQTTISQIFNDFNVARYTLLQKQKKMNHLIKEKLNL